MANWQNKINLADVWNSGDFKLISKTIIARLEKIDFGEDLNDERDVIIEAFQDLIDDKEVNINEFDSLMSELYDFADTKLDSHWNGKKILWVSTI